MDINIFLMSNKSKLPSRLDLLNNIHQKAKSINEEEATKIMPILSMSKFYNPFLMTVIALPFTILIVAILLGPIIISCIYLVKSKKLCAL